MLSLKCVNSHPLVDELRDRVQTHTGDGPVAEHELFADVSLTAGSRILRKAEKVILASFSPIMSRAMSDAPTYPETLLILPDTSVESLDRLLDFLRGQEINFSSASSYEELLELMHLLDIDYVNNCCLVGDTGDSEEWRDGDVRNHSPISNLSMPAMSGHDNSDQRNDSDSPISAHDVYLRESNHAAVSESVDDLRSSDMRGGRGSVYGSGGDRRNFTNIKREVSDSVTINGASSFKVKKETFDASQHERIITSPAETTDSNANGGDGSADVLISCKQCSKCFSSSEFLLKHVKRSHNVTTTTSTGAFKCAQCDHRFDSAAAANAHLRKTHGVGGASVAAQLSCALCEKRFSMKSSLRRHNLMVHMRLKPFGCDQCAETFAQRCDLTKHYRTHTGERPFCCGQCGRGFARQDSLSMHEATIHGKRSGSLL